MNPLNKPLNFKISNEYDHEATAVAKTAFGKLAITIIRDEPDCSDDERRAVCSFRAEIEQNDGKILTTKTEELQFFGHIRENLVDYLADAFPTEQSVADLSDKLEKSAKRKHAKKM